MTIAVMIAIMVVVIVTVIVAVVITGHAETWRLRRLSVVVDPEVGRSGGSRPHRIIVTVVRHVVLHMIVPQRVGQGELGESNAVGRVATLRSVPPDVIAVDLISFGAVQQYAALAVPLEVIRLQRVAL